LFVLFSLKRENKTTKRGDEFKDTSTKKEPPHLSKRMGTVDKVGLIKD
jgi:hypothetical protein